jgi:sugar phosphate permease
MIKAVLLPLMMLLVATLFYLYEFTLRVAPSSMFTDLMRDYNLGAASLGWLGSIYFFSYAFLQLPVGAWTDRFGPRRLLTFAIILCAASTFLFSFTDSFFLVCVARFFIGAGSAFAFISCMKIITVWFKPHWFPILTGLTLTIGTMGGVIGQVSVSIALEWLPWRELMRFLGVVGVVLAILAWIFIKDKNENNPHPSYDGIRFMGCLKEVMRSKQNWWVALYGFMMTAPTDAFGGLWGIPFLVQAHDFPRDIAASACSMTFVGMAVGSPIIGWFSNKIKNRRIPMFLGSLGSLLSILILVYWPTITHTMAFVLFFLFGFMSSYVLAFVVIRDIMPPQLVGTAVGFVNMASMIGSFLLMYIMGWLLEKVWNGELVGELPFYDHTAYKYGLLIMPICYIISTFILIPIIRESYSQYATK